MNNNKGGTVYLGALSQNEANYDSYANLALTLSIDYTVPPTYVSITADNNFTVSGGTHGSVIVDGSTQTAPYTFSRATGMNVTIQAVSPQTDNQGYQRVWSSSCDQSYWSVGDSRKSNNQSYSFTASTGDNGVTYLANLHQNRVTTSGTMAANEMWISSVALTGNVTVPSGVTLTITSCATVNLLNGSNRYSIVSTGGTINKQAGATISNLRATLTHNGSELKGFCGTVQAAVNVIPDLSVKLDIGAVNPSLYAYNCTNLSFHDANVSDRYAYVNDTALRFNQSSTSSVTGSTLLYHNVRAVLASASTVNLNGTYFCNNTYDLTTNSGATITALFCYFPGGVPTTQGSGI